MNADPRLRISVLRWELARLEHAFAAIALVTPCPKNRAVAHDLRDFARRSLAHPHTLCNGADTKIVVEVSKNQMPMWRRAHSFCATQQTGVRPELWF